MPPRSRLLFFTQRHSPRRRQTPTGCQPVYITSLGYTRFMEQFEQAAEKGEETSSRKPDRLDRVNEANNEASAPSSHGICLCHRIQLHPPDLLDPGSRASSVPVT